MMTQSQASAIRKRCRVKCDVLGLPLSFDNVVSSSDKPKAHISIREGDSTRIDSHTIRTWGVVFIQVFELVGQGDGGIRSNSNELQKEFTNTEINGVHFGAASAHPVGLDGDSWQVNVKAPFWIDERV